MSTTADLAVQLVQLGDQITELNAKKKILDAEYETIEKLLLEQYDQEKVTSVTVSVGDRDRIVYASKRFWARKKDDVTSEQVYDALIADGIDQLATRGFNTNSLSAYLKDKLSEEGASLPPNLAQVIDAKEYPSISTRKK
jgi:hypothetical protein